MRYYRKLLRAFLSIALVYTLLLNITFITWYQFSSRKNTLQAVDAAASRFSEYADLQLQSVKEIAHLLRVSEYTQKYLSEKPGEPDHYTRLKLYRFISSIFGVTSSHKNGIAVTKLTDDYAIMHNSTGNLEQILSEFHLNRSQLEEAAQEFQVQFNLPMKILSSMDSEGRKYYTVLCREWLGQQNPLYILVSYTEQQFLNTGEIGEAVFAVCYNGKPAAAAGEASLEKISQWLAEGCPAGWSQRGIPSDISGIQYITYVPTRQPLTQGLLMISLAGLLLMSLSFFVMYLLTRRMYSPIAETLLNSDIQITSGNEFTEIRNAFHTLHENVESLSQSLGQYRLTAENKFFHDLFTGLLPPEQIPGQMRELGLRQEEAPFTAVLVRYDDTAELGGGLSGSLIYRVKRRLTIALCDELDPIRLYQVIDLNFGTQGLIFQTADSAALSDLLRKILFHEEPEYGVEITAYIGGTVNRLSDIADSYRQAAQLIAQNELSRSREQIISCKLQESLSKAPVYYPISLEQTLISGVIHGKTRAWQSALRELLAANRTPEKRAQLSFMLTATVNRMAEGANEPIESFFPEGTIIYLEFRSCPTPESFLEKAYSIFSAIETHLEQKERQSDRSMEKEMLRFIQTGYMRDISLLDLAEHLNMSRNYVSTLFKNLTGRNFKEYLNEYRYQAACSLIRENPNLKIRDVAEKAGCSTDILHRLFLRYGGMTPSEYQQQARQKEKL